MANIYKFLKTASIKKTDFFKKPSVFTYLLAAILISIPLKNIFVSLTIIALVLTSLLYKEKKVFTFNKYLILPIALYFIMILSLLWTRELNLTLKGLQKELPFLFIPIAFFLIPKLSRESIYKSFRWYGFSMVLYALYYLTNAFFRYIDTNNATVFFYHQLVTLDLNAIYVSVFASFAVFYFVSIKEKKTLDKIALIILSIFIFLLSSKSIITIDFIMIICYYSFFAPISNGVKTITITTVSLFVIFSLFFVKEVKDRFLLEYETAFVDNTLNNKNIDPNGKVYNVSLKQAWTMDKFQQNHFFPGTAMRVYQMRIFIEMLQKDHILFTGYGLEASQDKIKAKVKEHNLYNGYGEFNFHNQYVQTFSELGVVAFIILLAMLYYNFNNAWKQKDFLHIAFAITMIILFLSESFFCRQRGIVFFITIYCMFNLLKIEPEETQIDKI
ncbi:O-antigen ligase family protein [Flavobacterium sp. SUN052]|uniref:O-antigen ligase family protein n=1 Tax=Flavobacterium sp. SUN052 TaxID=3002441 RepID=UPI00237ECEF6|nr:O-antigen ligase family protein [Flavobacterium sp. SUN052]MEC4003514.1 O-antigen ligase family protein [Flavobacterium sp. SUN052]